MAADSGPGHVGGTPPLCTVVSALVKDEGTGFSTCTAKGYLLLGGVGLSLGALIGLVS